MKNKITFENLTLAAGDFRREGISFAIPEGQCGVLMGKTGCGKTTLMETLCGLRNASGGRILIGERDITDLPPRLRGIGYVPQDVALFASMNVYDNIAFSLSIHNWKPEKIKERVEALAESLGLSDLLKRRTQALSGGEAKRVSLGRALALRPEIICLDEPLSALDESTHDSMVQVIREAIVSEGLTAFLITHDSREAEMLGDSIVRW